MATDKVVVDIITNSDKSQKSVLKFAAGVGVATVAIGALVKVGKELVAAYAVQEQAEARLEQTIKSTGRAAGLTSDELKKMATGLQGVTKFGDEAIIGAQSLLLTFKDIGGETFPRALESILDVSEAMGTGLKESSIQVGKALNDPVQGISALTRVGIQFTDAQKDMIKALVETGDKAGAQAVILEELESQFGGVAKAAADTASGSFVQLQNATGDLKEAYGGLLAEALKPMNEVLIEMVTNWTKVIDSQKTAIRFASDMEDGVLDQKLSLDELKEALIGVQVQMATGGSFELLEQERNLENLINQEERRLEAVARYRKEQELATQATAEAEAEATTAAEKRAEATEISNTKEQERIDLLAKQMQSLIDVEAANIAQADALDEIANSRATLKTIEEQEVEIVDDYNILLQERIDKENELLDVMAMQPAVVKKIAEEVQGLEIDFEILTESAMNSFASAFQLIGREGMSAFDVMKQAGKDAISAILKGLAQQMLAQAALYAFTPGMQANAAGLVIGAAGAYAASGLVQSFATGGTFVTQGNTMVGGNLLGDNASGQERVTVEPLGGSGGNSGGRERFELVAPGYGIIGYIQKVGIDNRKLHSSRGGAL